VPEPTTPHYDVAACVEVIERHRHAFGVGESYPLRRFIDMVAHASSATLECSCKIEGDEMHAARFNLWFQDDDRAAQMAAVLAFLRDVEAEQGPTLDDRLFRAFYTPAFDWTGVRAFVVGVDLREHAADSRLKVWFMLDEPATIDAALTLSPFGNDARRLVVGPGLLIGFDLFLDGRSAVKLYPRVTHDDLQRPETYDRLAALLPSAVLAMMSESRWSHISFTDTGERIVHCRPADPRAFLERFIADARVGDVATTLMQGEPFDAVVSCRESDIVSSRIHDVNLYATFGRRAAQRHRGT
jgi:LynF/TruF/PatF family peptide O-prenyltransferase